MRFSVVIPIFNRPEELDELLNSLTHQTFKDFEIIIIEDGSTKPSDKIFEKYKQALNIQYYETKNQGQGFARNLGSSFAKGDILVFFDSDVVVPKHYFETVNSYFDANKLDAYGGEDRASADFTPIQKAISYSMTSFLTTGGIRSRNKSAVGSYQIRSYNLGIKRDIFNSINGFKKTNMGEDMELNARLNELDIKKELIPNAYVYHKRRGSFNAFFKQIFSFGRTRIQLKREYNISIKLAHTLPVLFVLFMVCIPISYFISIDFAQLLLAILALYLLLNAWIGGLLNKSVWIGILIIPIVLIQHLSYGLGFIYELFTSKKG